MVKRAKMIFDINPNAVSLDSHYGSYPAYFIKILEENNGEYEQKGEWYISEDNFLDVLHAIIKHERTLDMIRSRKPQAPNLLQKIAQRTELDELWEALDYLTKKYLKLIQKMRTYEECET